jgi:hypothetical protein
MFFAFGLNAVSAQITINIPKIKIGKPKKEQPKTKDTTTTSEVKTKTNNTTTTSVVTTKTSDSKLIYPLTMPTNAPVFLKNSVYVEAKVHDEYWKMKGQRNYSSWVPLIRFNQFYNEEKVLNYRVEYFNPDGSAWYGEELESSGRNADRTVLYKSPSPYGNGVLDTKSTNGTGVYSFKITNQDTKEVLFQGKFKVGKFSRAYSPQEKNKNGFYVEHDWLLPFGTIGFHFSGFEIGGMNPMVDVWLKGDINRDELEGRVFYKGQQIASTKDGANGSGANSVNERMGEYAAAFEQDVWKQWRFQWGDLLFDNNGSFNRENYPKAFYLDKNAGDYTVKIYRGGTQIRELGFSVGADGKFVVPAYTSQIPMPYHAIVLPVKVVGTAEKMNAAAWKTDAFYGNPLSGFAVQ